MEKLTDVTKKIMDERFGKGVLFSHGTRYEIDFTK